MIINNCVQNSDGSLDFDFHVDPDEASFLMDLAIKELVRRGVFSIATDVAQQELDLFKGDGGMVS
jgi:hypothetical protein